jgi:alanine-glyoxylate transaminase/serine-glyoxylate transaminase/serine-pyruvate transaminase
MNNLLNTINETLLMGPGPSSVAPTVYSSIGKSTIGHLDPKFIEIMDAIKLQLQTLMGTKNELTIPISGTGSAGMETCFVNLIEHGEEVLILSNGVFGGRMIDVCERLGANVDSINQKWGEPITTDMISKKINSKKYDLIAIVHAETSTGVLNPIKELAPLIKESNALFVVDAVTSLGGVEICMDDWGIDALYSGTQKCLSCPPGLSPVSFSERAVNKLMNRKSKVPNWYLDLSMIANYWSGKQRAYHHTAPINMVYALYQALFDIIEEGPKKTFQKHADAHQYLLQKLEELNLELLVEKKYRLPMLNAIKIPAGISDIDVRSSLLNDYNIEIGGGLGNLAGNVWRVGLMGHTAKNENIDRLFTALSSIL